MGYLGRDRMQGIAIINRSAGSTHSLDLTEFALKNQNAFRKNGHDVAVELPEPQNLGSSIDRAVDKKPDFLIVGGGDGTVRCAAQALWPR